MSKSFANLDAELIEKPGYYFNDRLCKLARLQAGQKVPDKLGCWEFIAGEHELSSSQVVRKLLDMKPGIDPQQLTYTVHSPLERRVPPRAPVRRRWARNLLGAAAILWIGLVIGRRLAD